MGRTKVIIEQTGILRKGIDRASESAPCLSMDGVAMRCSMDIWARFMNGRVDMKTGSIDRQLGAVWRDMT